MKLGIFHFQLLYNVLENIHFIHDEDELANVVLSKVAEALNAEAGSIFKITPEGAIVPLASFGAPLEQLKKLKFVMGQGVVGWVAQYVQPVKVDNPRQDTRFQGAVDNSTGFKTRSIIAAPILAKGRPIGIIEFLNRRGGLFAGPDIELISMVGREIGIAFENTRLIQNIERARAFQEAVLNSFSAGVCVVDQDRRVLKMNPRAKEILGLNGGVGDEETPPSSRVFASIPELLHVIETLDKPVMRQEINVKIQGKDAVLGYSGVPVLGRDSSRLGSAILFQDITAYVPAARNG